MMIACYDLGRCPPTYDVVAFLALAELERLSRGEDQLDIQILPGPAAGFRRDSLWPRTIEERVHMRDHVVAPICGLLPSVQQVVISTDRTREFGADTYTVGLPRILAALRQGCRPLRANCQLSIGVPFITFTLREAVHHPLRNSQVDEWLAAAQILLSRGFNVIIVRDACKANIPLPGQFQFSLGSWIALEAALDISVRAALYSSAILNVGISNGPMWMSMFMDAPTLMLRPTTNPAQGCYDDHFFARHGLPPGSQLPTSPPYQRLLWKDDTCNNIVDGVDMMLEEDIADWLVG